MIKLAASVIVYLLLAGLGLYSLAMLYALLRFGKSKLLGLLVTAFYLILMLSLYSAVQSNFDKIVFPTL